MGNRRAGFSTAGIKDVAVKQALDRIAEMLQTYDGVRGDPLDRVITLRDLLGTTDAAALARRHGGVRGGLVDAIGGGGDAGETDATPPPAPTALTAAGAFGNVILAWEFSEAYSNLSHFEILRADTDNYAQATVVGTTAARVHADEVGLSMSRYYWVRAVSRANVVGPANAVAGTQGRTADDPVAITELLTQRDWEAATFVRQYYVVAPSTPVEFGGVAAVFQATGAGVTGATEPNWAAAGAIGGTVVDNGVTWEAIEPGKAPLVIGTVNGQQVVALATALIQDASIESAKIQSLAADKLYAESGTIASAIIGTGHILNAMIGGAIYSDNYVTGSTGWLINKNGQFELNGGTIRGALHVGGQLSGTSGTFAGSLTAGAVNAVNTINLAGDAVTVQYVANQAAQVNYITGEVSVPTWKQIITGAFNAGSGATKVGKLVVFVNAEHFCYYSPPDGGGTVYASYRLLVNGVVRRTWTYVDRATNPNSEVHLYGIASLIHALPAAHIPDGSATYSIEASFTPNGGVASASGYVRYGVMTLDGAKR